MSEKMMRFLEKDRLDMFDKTKPIKQQPLYATLKTLK